MSALMFLSKNYMALVTLFERRHLVHTFKVTVEPFTTALIFLTLGFQVLLVLLTEWLTLLPNVVALLQISHFAINTPPPLNGEIIIIAAALNAAIKHALQTGYILTH